MIRAVGGYRNLRYLHGLARYQRALRKGRSGELTWDELSACLAHMAARTDIERYPENESIHVRDLVAQSTEEREPHGQNFAEL